MRNIINTETFNFISDRDKAFIISFDEAINKLGYDCGLNIGNGYCWGKYMIIYSKTGAKSKKVAARIYIRDDSIVLRLFLNKIDDHRKYIENTPDYIKNVFVSSYGDCHRCKNDKNGVCKFRKSYTIDNKRIEKCNGFTFEFYSPDILKLPDYMDLLSEFYPVKRLKKLIKTIYP